MTIMKEDEIRRNLCTDGWLDWCLCCRCGNAAADSMAGDDDDDAAVFLMICFDAENLRS